MAWGVALPVSEASTVLRPRSLSVTWMMVMPSRCDTGQQSFCQATVFPAMVMVVGCEENLTEARMSSHASALLNTRGCSHSSEWKKLRGRVMYPFSIFADYRHFADSVRKNREKGREMPWHFRIDGGEYQSSE